MKFTLQDVNSKTPKTEIINLELITEKGTKALTGLILTDSNSEWELGIEIYNGVPRILTSAKIKTPTNLSWKGRIGYKLKANLMEN